jgi:tripartite-type tricarboxylate transporter receptor subunit TctC
MTRASSAREAEKLHPNGTGIKGGFEVRHALIVAGCLLLGSAAVSGVAAENAYPTRPITFIVPWGPGGGADQLARIAGKLMEQELKVSFPVINVAGATGQTGLTKLVTGPADGYTIEVMTGDTFALFAAANARFKLDQLVPLGVMIQQPSGFFVKMDSPWKTWADVEAAAREKPLRVAVTGFGSPDDFTVNYFRSKGLKLESVPFAEPGLRYSSVIGGQSDLVYEQAGDIRSFLDGKQIRPVLFFSDKPFEAYPDIPYSKKLGYDVKLPQFRVIVAKAGTSPAQVKVLTEAIKKVGTDPEFTAYLKQQLGEPQSFVAAGDAIPYMNKWLEEASELSASSKAKQP